MSEAEQTALDEAVWLVLKCFEQIVFGICLK